MRTRTIILGLFIGVACAAISNARVAAQQPLPANDPGHPTPARVTVLNRDPSEAIPVVSTTPVEISTHTTLGVRTTAQAWEYRTVRIVDAQDPAAVLNALGADGWEAVGLTTRTGGDVVLLKRPR